MGFRLVAGAAAALLAMIALSQQSSAADTNDGSPSRGSHHRSMHFRYGGYYGQIGGHYYGVVPERYEFLNESTYNYPGFYNNQTFWERVITQRNYPVQY